MLVMRARQNQIAPRGVTQNTTMPNISSGKDQEQPRFSSLRKKDSVLLPGPPTQITIKGRKKELRNAARFSHHEKREFL